MKRSREKKPQHTPSGCCTRLCPPPPCLVLCCPLGAAGLCLAGLMLSLHSEVSWQTQAACSGGPAATLGRLLCK